MPQTEIRIKLPLSKRLQMINHCQRKLAGNYLENENRNLKAFGLLGGEKTAGMITIKAVYTLLRNARSSEPHRQFMDKVMDEHAIPSETPLHKRGWVADPEELALALHKFKAEGLSLVGSYHMHRVAWEQDSIRDTPTTLDTILGRDSRMLMFIISMVDPEKPIIRAFAEGSADREIPIDIIDD